jgi:hypothetical protein
VEWETLGWLSWPDYSDPGTLDGDTIRGIKPFQVYWPYSPPIYPDTSNPIAAWRATWTTADFAHRDVTIGTLTDEFWVYEKQEGYFFNVVDALQEDQATIKVVPVPGAGCLFMAAFAIGKRARRSVKS